VVIADAQLKIQKADVNNCIEAPNKGLLDQRLPTSIHPKHSEPVFNTPTPKTSALIQGQ